MVVILHHIMVTLHHIMRNILITKTNTQTDGQTDILTAVNIRGSAKGGLSCLMVNQLLSSLHEVVQTISYHYDTHYVRIHIHTYYIVYQLY